MKRGLAGEGERFLNILTDLEIGKPQPHPSTDSFSASGGYT
jgi:hypothetical protein